MEDAPMTTEIPKWAYDYLRTQLPPDAELLNSVLIEKGRYSGAVLANTTRGAVLVTKSSVGEPRGRFLPVPGNVRDLTCEEGGQTAELHNAPLPVEVHCSRCGAVQRVPSPTKEPAAKPPSKK
jgi:hypothetical protein